jgi:HEAT repeat protein
VGEPAVDALFKIYDSSQDLEIRKSVISGFGNRKSERAGAKLVEIASSSSENIELRKQAIRSISRRGGENAVDTLMKLYDAEKNEEVKDTIMNSFGNLNDKKVTNKLLEIAKNPQTPLERRRRVIMLLSNRGKDPDVIAYLEQLLRQQ